jgi:hypothetical protein
MAIRATTAVQPQAGRFSFAKFVMPSKMSRGLMRKYRYSSSISFTVLHQNEIFLPNFKQILIAGGECFQQIPENPMLTDWKKLGFRLLIFFQNRKRLAMAFFLLRFSRRR